MVTTFAYLAARPVSCYLKRVERWIEGEYLFTIDWFDDNEQAHVVRLSNGQFAALPNHKIKFRDGARSMPDYRKLHATWRLLTAR